MSDKKSGKGRTRKEGPSVGGSGTTGTEATTTFGVRFTDQQRKVLLQAAELRGWSMTKLLRNAGLEKAAHVVNTSTLTKFPFKTLAQKIAEHLYVQPTILYMPQHPEADWEEIPTVPDSDFPPLKVAPDPLPASVLSDTRKGFERGGAEFLRLIVEAWEELAASKSDLPDPIDPATLGTGERS